ncbi:MAG: hypothetical protein MJZ22_01590 [Candidatus Saccharibacteria bacterium]|nr:hypothetical protein [Candidatus Saccharibacteria bacterium]
MQKQRFRLRNNFILNILFSFSSFVLALFGFLAVLPPASEPEVSAIIDGEQFALTVTNSEAINLEINPTESGSIAVAKDTIVANTNSPAGYKLYVSTDSETSNNIHLNGRESNDTEDKKIVAASGTFNAPAALEQNESSWGFALAGVNGFDSSYDIANPSPSAKFAAVPEKNNEQLIHDHTGRATDDQTEIYFAAKANTSIASGNYQTTILYTTLSEATDQDQTEINLDKTVFPNDYETKNKTINVDTSIMVSKTPNLIVEINNIRATNVIVTSISPLSFTFDLPANLTEGKYDFTATLENLAKSYTKPKAITIKPAMAYMQDMTPEVCDSLVLEEQIQLMDKRDDKIYWVSKLKDGNCWMTQNLDYDLSVAENQTLVPETSNVTTTRSVAPDGNFTSGSLSENGYLDGGDYYYVDGLTKTEGASNLPEDSADRHYAVGNYYSWKTATAGLGTPDAAKGKSIEESICPAGWNLPIGNSKTANLSFGNLVRQYGYSGGEQNISATSLRAAPLFLTWGGYINTGANPLRQGTDALYWTATSDSSEANWAFFFTSGASALNPNNSYTKYRGFAIRCVAPGRTMQNIDDWRDDLAEEEQIQVKDERDNKFYWVSKLKDGNIWMTQNLDYDLSVADNRTLKPETSNVTTTRTISLTTTWGENSNAMYYKDGGDYYYTNGTTQTEGYSTLPADSVDRHYARGDYYSWRTATAGVGTTSITSADVNESICPAGWRLPTSNSADANYSFGNLVKQYGYTGTNESASDVTLLASPLFFARGGNIYSGSLDYQGSRGFYWSSRAYSDSNFAYYLYFSSSSVYPSYHFDRYYGFSVRCVAL